MKNIILYLILLMSFTYAVGQDSLHGNLSMNDFVAIRIQSGLTHMGTNSLFLMREGFGYWRNPFLETNKIEKTCFIPFSKLNYQKVWRIIEYVYDNKLMEAYSLDSLNIPDNSCIHRESLPIKITIYSYSKQDCTVIQYNYKNKIIDGLIEMMNDLIPLKDKRKFRITGFYTTL